MGTFDPTKAKSKFLNDLVHVRNYYEKSGNAEGSFRKVDDSL